MSKFKIGEKVRIVDNLNSVLHGESIRYESSRYGKLIDKICVITYLEENFDEHGTVYILDKNEYSINFYDSYLEKVINEWD